MITFRGSQLQDMFWPLVEFVSGSPWFNCSAALVNSQLAYLQPVGILSSCRVMLLPFDRRDCIHWSWKATMGSRQLSIVCVCGHHGESSIEYVCVCVCVCVCVYICVCLQQLMSFFPDVFNISLLKFCKRRYNTFMCMFSDRWWTVAKSNWKHHCYWSTSSR